MGIYPEYSKSQPIIEDDGTQTWMEFRQTPGLIEERHVTSTPWEIKERTDCFCCSCPDEYHCADPACRNHGWAAKRPCDAHNLPGQPWGEEAGPELDGKMPVSVQQYREGN